MTDLHTQPTGEDTPATREEIISALFAHMVVQQANLGMMLLGKVAHPQTGKVMHDLESAKMLIDQLEMLEEKTKGNLSKEEAGLLAEAQTALRMAFVEAVDEANKPSAAQTPSAAPAGTIISPGAAPTPAAQPKPKETTPPTAEEVPDDSKKRFSKKY